MRNSRAILRNAGLFDARCDQGDQADGKQHGRSAGPIQSCAAGVGRPPAIWTRLSRDFDETPARFYHACACAAPALMIEDTLIPAD